MHAKKEKVKRKAQSASDKSTKRNHYVTCLFQDKKPQGCKVWDINKYIFFSQSKKHCNFWFKRDGRKSKSLTTGEELQTDRLSAELSCKPWAPEFRREALESPLRGWISQPIPAISLGELGWKYGWDKGYKALGPFGD